MMLGGVGGARAMISVARTGVVIGTILTRAETGFGTVRKTSARVMMTLGSRASRAFLA